jgi:hypothetical protein
MKKEWKKELIELSKVFFKDDMDNIRSRYKIPNGALVPEITPSKHRKIVGEAVKIAERVIQGGGTTEEVRDVMQYFAVCIDALPYNLDYLMCAEETGIQRLKIKYGDVKPI